MASYIKYALIMKCGFIAVILFSCFKHAYGACTLPTVFQNSTWHDSREGSTVFGTSDVTGLTADFGSYGTVSDWECREETFDSNGRILLRAKTPLHIFFQDWYAYICIDFISVAPNSYMYYRRNAEEGQAGGARLKNVLSGTDDTNADISNTCDDGNGATGAEFALLIKSGSESSAYIQCPTPLLGRFNFTYTDSGGTTHCNDHSNPDHMNVCTDKTQLEFVQPCSQSPVYAPGSVYCVASIVQGDTTFVQLYNPGSADNSATFQFSCMAISSNSLSATIVYKNCTNQMTSTVVATDKTGAVIGSTITFTPYVFCQGGCTWPAPFESSTWLDNTRGTITFGTDTLTGWSMTIAGTTISNWECLDNSSFAGEGILLVKATDTFVYVSTNWVTYLCLSMTEVTTNSYRYYQRADQDEKGGYERALFSTDGTITSKNTICNSASVPDAEFHFMVKQGEAMASLQPCPSSLQSKFDYTVTDSSAGVTCDTSVDDWDVCTNTSMMTFNYTTCPTQMLYSSAGEVLCMGTLSSSGYAYTVVYNTDSSPTYQFSCMVSNGDGTAASFVYDNCTVGQTPTSYAKQHDGTDIGYLVTMTQKASCPNPGTGASSEGGGGGSIIPIVIGAVAGILLLILLFIIYWFCYRTKRFCFKKKEVGHSDTDNAVIANGHVNEKPMKIEDLMENPAITAHPEGRNTLTPLPPKPDIPDSTPRVLPPIVNHL